MRTTPLRIEFPVLKIASIEESSEIVSGISVRTYLDFEERPIGALSINGTAISYSISMGPPLTPYQVVDLLVQIADLAVTAGAHLVTPAAIYLSSTDSGYDAEIIGHDGDHGTEQLTAAEIYISERAPEILTRLHRRRIHILIGDIRAHRSFHLECNPLTAEA